VKVLGSRIAPARRGPCRCSCRCSWRCAIADLGCGSELAKALLKPALRLSAAVSFGNERDQLRALGGVIVDDEAIAKDEVRIRQARTMRIAATALRLQLVAQIAHETALELCGLGRVGLHVQALRPELFLQE